MEIIWTLFWFFLIIIIKKTNPLDSLNTQKGTVNQSCYMQSEGFVWGGKERGEIQLLS